MNSNNYNPWLPAASAPKNGSPFLADFGYPWPSICSWSEANKQWAVADFNIGMLEGQWIDPYFETDWEKPEALLGWMMTPSTSVVKIKMNLLEILKKEFSAWPVEDGQAIAQDIDGWLYASDEASIKDGGWSMKHPVCFGRLSIAEDFKTAIVTKKDFLGE